MQFTRNQGCLQGHAALHINLTFTVNRNVNKDTDSPTSDGEIF